MVPISVKDFTEYEDTEHTGHSVFSFMTEPVRTTGGYAIGSVDLIGYAWGEFTGVNLITWAYSEGPAMSGNTINVVASLPAADYTTVGKVYQYMGTTTATYTNGYFYTCVEIPGSGASTYEWQQLNVQPGGGGTTNPVPDDVIFITADNSTITEDFTDGEVYTIINEKLYNAISSEDNFRVMFVNTGTDLDKYTTSIENNIDTETSRLITFNMCDETKDFILEQGEGTNECILTMDFNRFLAVSNKANDNVSDRIHWLCNTSSSTSNNRFNISNLEPGHYELLWDSDYFYITAIIQGHTLTADISISSFGGRLSDNDIINLEIFIRPREANLNDKFGCMTRNTYDGTGAISRSYLDLKIAQATWSITTVGAQLPNTSPHYLITSTQQTFSGVKTFNSLPICSVVPTTDNQLVNKKYVDDSVSSQVSTMPTADSTNVGNIVQYTGTTDSTYTNGYFYECKAQGTSPETYAWEAISVQAGGGGGLLNLSDVDNGGLQQTTCTVNNPSLRANSVALGYQTSTNGYASLAEGYQTKTLGQAAHAEGQYTIALGQCAHAEGYGSQASSQTNYIGARGYYSHSEGIRTCASGTAAHAEGYGAPDSHIGAYGNYSHTEGSCCHASAENAHAEGSGCYATGVNAHAEGLENTAASANSHVEGRGNIVANLNNSEIHIQGRYANENNLSGTYYAHVLGNGSSGSPSNAHTIDWSGNAWFAGDIKVGGTSYGDASATTLVTQTQLNNVTMRLPYRMGYTQFTGLTLPQHSSEGSETFTFPLPSDYTGADTKVLQTYIYGVSGGSYFNNTHYFAHASISEIMDSYFIMIEVYYGANSSAVGDVTMGVTLCEF